MPPNVRVTCDLAADGKSIVCTITAIPPTSKSVKIVSALRVAGTKLTTHKTGRGKVKMRLRSSKRLRKAPKVIVKVRAGKAVTQLTVRAH